MKAARDITSLAAEIQRMAEAKADYVAPTPKITMLTPVGEHEIAENKGLIEGNRSELHLEGVGEFGVLPWAHEQIGLHLGIPKTFYERLRVGVPSKNNRVTRPANPALLDHTVNTLLRQKPSNRLVRTVDGKARAFLSNRYRMLDYEEMAEAIFPVIAEMDSPLVEGEVTETRLYIKVLLPKIQTTVPEVGDVVQAGFIIKNSEVGLGSISVDPLVYTLICKNGMVVPQHGMRRYHVGRAHAASMEEAYEVYRDETLKQDDKAFWMKMQDVVRACADEVKFADIVARLGETAQTEPMEDVQATVEKLTKVSRYGITEGEGKSILTHLAGGGNLTLYGLHSAVTRAAQDVDSYDRSVELEAIGGELAYLPAADWKALAKA